MLSSLRLEYVLGTAPHFPQPNLQTPLCFFLPLSKGVLLKLTLHS